MAFIKKLSSKIYDIQAHTQDVTCLDLGETGRVLVTGGRDRNVNLWAFGTNQCHMSLAGHNGSIDCVKFAYNDDYVYSADENGIIKKWDLNTETGCSTFYGHMKSVRTLDFHPYGEYVVSGSNDTTVRLWDVRNNNSCIKKYRGHIANVNSVKFSPDGSWIASSGTEGSIIVWDIRMSKQLMDFQEHTSPVQCIQFHPFEFLLAAGRNDGSVDLYDLEKKQLVSRTTTTSPFHGHTIKCITFSENGECLFVGTAVGITTIGWEPDRQFDHIESSWKTLGDMKVVNKKLLSGSYENHTVQIHAINLDRIVPFLNPTNLPLSHTHSSRKSFSRGNQKVRLSLTKSKETKSSAAESINNATTTELFSPTIDFELIEEDEIPSTNRTDEFSVYDKYSRQTPFGSLPVTKTNFKYNNLADTGGLDSIRMDASEQDSYLNDCDYYPIKNSITVTHLADPQDFPINNAQQPNYAPKMDTHYTQSASKVTVKHKSMAIHQSGTAASHQTTRKMNNVQSASTMDLHRLQEPIGKKPIYRANSPIRNYINSNKIKKHDNSVGLNNKENNLKTNRKFTIQIMETMKPPTRSKTSLDLKSNNNINNNNNNNNLSHHSQYSNNQQQPPSIPIEKIVNSFSNDENSEILAMSAYHKSIYQILSNRLVTLQLIKTSSSNDILGALKRAIQLNDQAILVDLLGAILEKTSSWNLDMCVLLLPKIYELLQSNHKFHCTRACDTLRILLSSFLPIIQTNTQWGSSLGVDISREERTNKCLECRQWLIKIKALPEQRHIGQTFAQLQNMIIDL